jgi:hypothetical protein
VRLIEFTVTVAQHLADRAAHPLAGAVAERVVDSLEVIDVEHDQRHR